MIKKTLALIILTLSMAIQAMALSPSDDNRGYMDRLTNFFAARGITVKYELADNSLNFRYNEGQYWVSVYGDKFPFLIDFHKEGVKMKNTDRETDILRKCNEVNCDVMCGKAYLMPTDNGAKFVNFSTQFFISQEGQFIDIFNKAIDTLDTLERKYNSL